MDKVLRRDVLWRAWAMVRANDGAPGVDKITLEAVEEYGIDRLLGELASELRERRYRPLPARRVLIPKPGTDEKRPLSIPAVRDRIVQAALKIVFEPVFEADFLPCSFGFRPKRSAHDALQVPVEECARGRRWVVETDIASCFSAIPHGQLMEAVEERICDQPVLKLLRAMLRAGVMEDGRVRREAAGAPQGGVISPVMCNVYLHRLDRAWDERDGTLCRYADLCRQRHKSAYAEVRVMPASSEFSLVKSGRSSYGVGIILWVRRRPGFLVRVSDSSGQEDDHGDEHGFRRCSAGRGQHGTAGGVRQMAGPGARPVAGDGGLLLQAGEVLPRRGRRPGGRGVPGRGQGHRVHGGLVPGLRHRVGEGDGDVAAGVPAVRARDRPDGCPAGRGGPGGRLMAAAGASEGDDGGRDRHAAGRLRPGNRHRPA
jgi:retron-type reverse transcriptase